MNRRSRWTMIGLDLVIGIAIGSTGDTSRAGALLSDADEQLNAVPTSLVGVTDHALLLRRARADLVEVK